MSRFVLVNSNGRLHQVPLSVPYRTDIEISSEGNKDIFAFDVDVKHRYCTFGSFHVSRFMWSAIQCSKALFPGTVISGQNIIHALKLLSISVHHLNGQHLSDSIGGQPVDYFL